MILFLYGADSYRLSQRLKFLQEAYKTKFDEHGYNLAFIDGADFSIDEFRRRVKSVGLFVRKRFIVLNNLWSLKAPGQGQLLSELEGIGDDAILCVVGGESPRQDNKLFKFLLKVSKVEKYDELTPAQLRGFIMQKCREYGATIEPAAVDQLAAAVGNDLWQMSFEIKKMCFYTKKIDPQVVAEFVSAALDENIFHLTDALGARDARAATKLLEEQWELGANAQYLVTMLARQIGVIYKVRESGGHGLKLHPYVVNKAQQQARRFGREELRHLHTRLVEIDHYIKTHAVEPRVLLDMFMVEACSQV